MNDANPPELTPSQKLILQLLNEGATQEPATLLTALDGTKVAVLDRDLEVLAERGLFSLGDDCGSLEGVPNARSIMVKVCEHGSVHTILIDANRKPIAGYVLDFPEWMDTVEEVVADMKEFRKGAPATAADASTKIKN